MADPVTAAVGTLLKIDDGSGTSVFLTVGRIFSIGEVRGVNESIDVTTHDSPAKAREFITGLHDGGSVEIQGRFVADDGGQLEMKVVHDSGELREYQVVFPAGIGQTWTISALTLEFGTPEAPVEGLVNFTAVLKISGRAQLAATV